MNGFENHIWLVSCSDFDQDYVKYQEGLSNLLTQARNRKAYSPTMLRLAYIGVPPVFARSLYGFIEKNDGRVIYNETQRQFAMLSPGNNLAEQYTLYTYPYPIEYRIADISREIQTRKIDGVIHYVQSFCHRAIGDIILRKRLDIPFLTLEGGSGFFLNQHLKTRIEAFIDMLERSKIMTVKEKEAE